MWKLLPLFFQFENCARPFGQVSLAYGRWHDGRHFNCFTGLLSATVWSCFRDRHNWNGCCLICYNEYPEACEIDLWCPLSIELNTVNICHSAMHWFTVGNVAVEFFGQCEPTLFMISGVSFDRFFFSRYSGFDSFSQFLSCLIGVCLY